MKNLKDWQAWLNNISEPEWAAFMAQHGGEMDALRGAWARFVAQHGLGQPESALSDETKRQPENTVTGEIQTQPENVRQPENTQTAVQQNQAVNNIAPSNQSTQPDNTVSGCLSDTDLPSANIQIQAEQAASEVATAAVPAKPLNQAQSTLRQPENNVDNPSQTQSENAVSNKTKQQPENTQTAVQQNQAVNNTAPSNQSTQPDNTISGCLTDADLPSANVPAEPTEQAASEVATNTTPAQPSNRTPNQTQSTLRQPENGTDNLPQTQPENAVSNKTKQQPENPQTAVPQNQTTNNAAPGNKPIQPDNTVSGCPTDADLPSANIQVQAKQAVSEVTTAAAPAQPSNQMPDQTQNVLQQPENAISNETKQPQIPPSPLQHPHPPIPMPTPHTLPPLPNARCGEPYRAALPTDAAHVKITPECGLVWDAKHHQISGTPNQAGDIEIRYTVPEHGAHTPVRQTLYINPDPKSLWQNQPSDPTAPFAKPDTAHDLIATAQGSLIAARVRGRSHAHNGTHCDDDYRIAHHERTGLHFIAVADGAGSAEFSRYGSQLAVNAAAETVWQLLDNNEKLFRQPEYEPKDQKHALENLISNAAYQAFVAQKNAAETEQIDIKKLACTLLIALALPRADGTWLITAYWVGDGAAAVWQPESQTITLLGESDGGAYSGETVFLSANEVRPENLSQRTRSWQGQQPPVLMLMTDGISDPKFETDANLAKSEKWAALWQELQPVFQAEQPAAALEEWLDFWSPGNHDDRTLALFLPTKAA